MRRAGAWKNGCLFVAARTKRVRARGLRKRRGLWWNGNARGTFGELA